MKKVLIVDDEYLGRSSLRNLVDWSKFDMEVIGEEEDGEFALCFFERYHPDIVITDIKMPFMDGIELLKQIKLRDSKVIVVVVSSYDDFSYAQAALKYGASFYLLKPVEEEELQETLSCIAQKNRCEFNAEDNLLNGAKSISMAEEIYWRLISGSIDLEEAKQHLLNAGVSTKAYFKLAIYQLDEVVVSQEKTTEDMFEKQLQNVTKSTCDGQTVGCLMFSSLKNSQYIQCVWGHNPHRLDTVIELCAKKVRKIQGEKSLSILISESHPGVEGLSTARHQCLALLSYRYLLGKNKDIIFSEISDNYREKTPDELQEELDVNELVKKLTFTDQEELLEELYAIEKMLINKGENSLFFSQLIISNIISKVYSTMKEVGVEEQVIKEQMCKLKHVLFANAIQESFEGLRNILSDIVELLTYCRRSKYSVAIMKAKDFINKNYMKKDLALKDIAQHLFLSVAYFSVLFKKETGSTFLNYLTQVRMEKAKDLLMTNVYTVYDISEAVGYDNPTYFSTLFKRYYGMSPRDYKNRHGIDKEIADS